MSWKHDFTHETFREEETDIEKGRYTIERHRKEFECYDTAFNPRVCVQNLDTRLEVAAYELLKRKKIQRVELELSQYVEEQEMDGEAEDMVLLPPSDPLKPPSSPVKKHCLSRKLILDRRLNDSLQQTK